MAGDQVWNEGKDRCHKDEVKLGQIEFTFTASQKYGELKREQRETRERIFPFGKLNF